MTPIGSTFSIDINSKLDWETLGQILATGHSRVPVYSGDKRNVIGLILVKSLIAVRAEDETPVSTLSIRRLPRVAANTPLYDMLNEFQRGQSHMAAVVRTPERRSAPATEGNHINGTPFGNQVNSDMSDTLGASSEEPLLCARGMKPVEAVCRSCLEWKVDMVDKGHQVCCKPERSTGAEATKCSCNAEESEVIGIITLEDVFEELIQEEIVDETDEYVDVHRRIKVNGAHRESPPGVAQNGTDEICRTLSGTSVCNLTEPLLDKERKG